MIYLLEKYSKYPESYRLNCTHDNFDMSDLYLFERVEVDGSFKLTPSKKISEKRLLAYDFVYCTGFVCISPRLAELLKSNEDFLDAVQLLDAELIINNKTFTGYKLLHITRLVSAIDVEQSKYNTISGGIKIFKNIIFKEINEDITTARVSEYCGLILLSQRLKDLLVNNNIHGAEYIPIYDKNIRFPYMGF